MLRVTRVLPLLAVALLTDAAAAELGGAYGVEGKNPDGSPYKAQLTVSPSGEGWQFEWLSGQVSRGIGLQLDDVVAVAVGGAECAVVLYRVAADGMLQGRWIGPAGGTLGEESATPARDKAEGVEGDYLVTGKNANGSPYKGALGVARESEHWRLSWRTGSNFEGYGLERDGYLGVSWGSPACGVVLYRVAADGALDGIWKYYRTGVGGERATRR